MIEGKEKYQTVISEVKLKQYKSYKKFLNGSKDSTRFSTGMTKFLAGKQTGQHIFDDQEISEKLKKFHIEKIGKNESDLEFKDEIEEEIDSVLELNQTSSLEIFFNIKHIKEATENGNEQLLHCLTYLMEASYFLVYLARTWKKENRIYLKKTDKTSYHLENSYRSISLSNILGKIYKRIILQQATNILDKNNFFKGKNFYAYKK